VNRPLIAVAGAVAIAAFAGVIAGRTSTPVVRPAEQPHAAPRPPVPPALAPVAPSSAPSPELAAVLEDARAHLVAAARPCWSLRDPVPPGTPDATIGKLQFHYRLETDGSSARVAGFGVRRSSIADPALRDCIAHALADARWSSGAPAGTLPINDALRVGELTRHDGPS
jgi:hypothetical protein